MYINIINCEYVHIYDRSAFVYAADNVWVLDEITTLLSLAQFLESYRHEPSTSVNEILRVPIDPRIKVHFDDITIDLFLAMIYIRLHKYSQAKKHLDAFIKYMRSCNADTDAIRYNLLVSSILRCRINEMDDMAVVDCLSEHFHSDEVMSAIQDIRPETVFDGLPMCSCPNCKPCEYELHGCSGICFPSFFLLD